MAELAGRGLVVCGDAAAAEACARALREAGLEVATAGPAEAPGRATPELDLLVLDVAGLPDPAALVAAVREPAGDVAALLLAAAADLPRALACATACEAEVAPWPSAAPDLAAAAARALARGLDRTLAAEWRREVRAAGRGRLTGGIAHEIANALAILTSALDAGARELEALEAGSAAAGADGAALAAWWPGEGQRALPELRELLGEAGEGARRLKALARDVRDVVHGDPGTSFRIDLAEALEMALRVVRSDLAAHARVQLAVPAGLGVKANAGALAEVLLHVVRCAAQGAAASRAQGKGIATVAVRARLDGAAVLLEVEAASPAPAAGPAARRLARLLPPDATCGADVACLVVARDLLERMGGGLSARRTGEGARVLEVRLPVA